MGMGEPAHNLDNVLEAIELLGGDGAVGHKKAFSTVGDERVFSACRGGRSSRRWRPLRRERGGCVPNCCRARIGPAALVAAGETYARFSGYPMPLPMNASHDGDDEVEGIATLLARQYAIISFPTTPSTGWRSGARCAPPRWRRALHRRGVLEAAGMGGAGRRRRLWAVARAQRSPVVRVHGPHGGGGARQAPAAGPRQARGRRMGPERRRLALALLLSRCCWA